MMNTDASQAARALAARRQRVMRRCSLCGKEFTGVATKRYCSAACRLRASRERLRTNGSGGDEGVLEGSVMSHAQVVPPTAANEPTDLTTAVERLDRIREQISRGRRFEGEEDSTEILRRAREERTAELYRAVFGQER
jgi:hypothetical protein